MKIIDYVKRLNHRRLSRRQPRKHQRAAAVWYGLIDDYYGGKAKHYEVMPKHPELVGEKIIWQYWAQGFDESKLPEMIRLCYASVEQHRGDYRVIRLSD
ncbi:capsular polysaccharide synthesis protein, partial [uncultured Porphyromonas sp.]|uniref:capsular polysaccharide synthesis protein n=1 Tax=uncultured Porphyromonas sp. TaxID=159274 RepID=UPI002612E179